MQLQPTTLHWSEPQKGVGGEQSRQAISIVPLQLRYVGKQQSAVTRRLLRGLWATIRTSRERTAKRLVDIFERAIVFARAALSCQ